MFSYDWQLEQFMTAAENTRYLNVLMVVQKYGRFNRFAQPYHKVLRNFADNNKHTLCDTSCMWDSDSTADLQGFKTFLLLEAAT